MALAAHPDQEDIVALSTEYGLYISEDAISYLSQNPQAKDTFFITTHERDIFYTENQGDLWEKQAKKGLY